MTRKSDRSGILDKYEMMGVVGEGSYGTVHRARNRENGRIVAIKKFIEDDSNTLKIAQRELRALRRLRHENLVNMLEHTRKWRRLYIVFEYVDGTVLDFLESQRTKQIEYSIAREITWQLLRALEFIHQHGMIHRDIKPENILYSKDGVVKLCDFGFARPNAKINGEIFTDYVATRWYRAPELLVKELHYDEGVDIWAVGCLLPEMLSGDALFPGESDLDQLQLIVSICGPMPKHLQESFRQKPEFYSRRAPEAKINIPMEQKCRPLRSHPSAHSFIRHCLTMSPSNRPSATELLSNSEYLHESDFQRSKSELLERIRQANAPPKSLKSSKSSSNEYKYSNLSHVSASTSKLHHLKNAYAHKKSDLSEKSKSNSYLNSYEFSGDSFAQLKKKAKTTHEHKTMPEITQKSYKGSIQINRPKQSKPKVKTTMVKTTGSVGYKLPKL